jgi:single-strand DNA-binding protein
VNNVALIGRLTRDPELRYAAGTGMAVAQFTLAVDKGLSREKKQQYEQQNKPTADFIRIVVFGKQAEYCANYLANGKGRRVAIQGSISVSTYKTNTGETRYTTDVLANNVEIIDWGDKDDNRRSGMPQQQQKSTGSTTAFDDDFANDFRAIEDDDDIPF